ncbi:GNAT family N-acetyltransferase [Lichenicola cladoniae]|uniref:GNAT family N-acetyltransferase n=1 Tax=Lichenicola cladoniae TaxID=1484109 RepID=A0A6M8HN18_9PROT|nr:GNAT family N-acetyltransferase [Acetobacteraceae bacterium]QKE89705.1 GNAT family N-acetyltransferase [Lichenicola cladoniae]
MVWTTPVRLAGRHVTLLPLEHEHHDGLVEAARDGMLWRLWFTSVPNPDEMADDIATRLAWRDQGIMLPFTVTETDTGAIVGMTSFGRIDPIVRRMEIGWTWYAERVQRTALNTEAKRLMLTHAFETLDCVAVELRTHFMNYRSRRAIERLGAKLDGVLRHNVRTRDGTLRDSCSYSIIAAEWPAVRSHLAWELERPR